MSEILSEIKVRPFTHPDLKKSAPSVVFDTTTLENVVIPLFDMLYRLEVWCLAGPEVGINARIFVMDLSEDRNHPQCFINPEIVEKKESILSEEDSLSLPGVGITVSRAKEITVRYLDEKGIEQTLSAEGMPAVCIQQKIDQLNGIQLLDHLSKLKRERLLKKIEKEGMPHASCGHGCGHEH